MNLDPAAIRAKAEEYRPAVVRFLRDMIAIPSESGREEGVIKRIYQEMQALGFDRVQIDGLGNVLGFMGEGERVIAFDGHVDTVGLGDVNQWLYDPYQGYEDDEIVYGRGASDQEGGVAAMIYGAKIMKDLGLVEGYTLLVVGSVFEEDCDGLCWQYIIEESGIRPEFCVLTEPTSLTITRGQRGRMEIKVETQGVASHGSAPERGVNAIFKMAPILADLERLHPQLHYDEFLGKGSLTVSEAFSRSPSRCAVADGCSISIDRRLTDGEDWQEALEQIRRLPSVQAANAVVSLYSFEKPSHTGLVYPTDCYFPTWVLPAEHPVCLAAVDAYKGVFDAEPVVDKWTFSTNGVSIMGRYGIPCVGFGPGHEDQAHAPNEKTWKDELVKAMAMYAMIPATYVRKYPAKPF